MKTTTPPARNPVSRSLPLITSHYSLITIPLVALACFALSPAPKAFGVSPAPDGGYPGNNTAEGTNALFSLTTGIDNTAIGLDALFHNTTGGYNTANGLAALFSNTTGFYNTANGLDALYHNIMGAGNTANGEAALFSNTTGSGNTGNGFQALYSNNASGNSATGYQALFRTTTGPGNTGDGYRALFSNTTGSGNTANGSQTLQANTNGNSNTAIGRQALFSNTSGTNNIGLGQNAGYYLTTGSYNIDIGRDVTGVAGESNTIRIGSDTQQMATFIAGIRATAITGTAVVVSSNGQLGVMGSSQRFKDDIKPMDKASESILALKPVTFHYKTKIDPQRLPQFGLLAEEVEKVNPDLVGRDAEGKVYTVRYEAVNAMLLNEFLKEHRKNEKQEATIAQQQKRIDVLTARLDEQASQIQKVSALLAAHSFTRLALREQASQTVFSNQ